MKLNLTAKKFYSEGDITHEYNPLHNKLTEDGSLQDFVTDEISLDLNNPVSIECQPSYDGTVNLIINDDKNPPRIVNTTYTTIEDNRYRRIVRNQTEQTNIYREGKIDTQTRLFRNINKIPKIDLVNVSYSGQLKGGNYTFYIKLADNDYNKTDIVAESGMISIFKGSLHEINTISGTLEDERTDKSITLMLTNIDVSFNKIFIYCKREYSDLNGVIKDETYFITKPCEIKGTSQTITINGFEEITSINEEELNIKYNICTGVKTQAQVQNMLFLGNIQQTILDNATLQNLSYYIRVKLVQREDSIGYINPGSYTKISEDEITKTEYYHPLNIYYYLGYWPSELYRLGIVYIFNDDSLSPVYNLRGCEFSDLDTVNYIGVYNKDEHISQDEFFIPNTDGTNLSNTKGVFKLPDKSIYSKGGTKGVHPLGFEFTFDSGLINELRNNKKLNIKGFFFVRQKRIPNILCQGFSIGVDRTSYIPLIYGVQDEEGYTTESFIDSSLGLSTDYSSRLISTANIQSSGLLSVDTMVNYQLQSMFDNSEFIVEKAYETMNSEDKLSTSLSNKRHYYINTIKESADKKYATKAKCVYIDTDIPLKYYDSYGFSTRVGSSEDCKDVRFLGSKNYEQNNNKIVRGIYCPFIGTNKVLDPSCIYNIKSGNYSSTFMSEYFKIRGNDLSPFMAISPRYELNDSKLQSRYDLYKRTQDKVELIEENVLTIDKNKYVNTSTEEYYLEEVKFTPTVFRGDCFTNTVTVRIIRNFIDSETPTNDIIVDPETWKNGYKGYNQTTISDWKEINRADVNTVPLGMWVTYKCLSNYNLGLRSEDTSYVDEMALMGNPRGFYPLHGINTAPSSKIPESTLLNAGYSTTVPSKKYFTSPDVPYVKDVFDTRIMFSNVQVEDDFRNAYRIFQGLDYKDIERQYGAIVKLISYGTNLFCVFEHGCALIPINEKALIATTTGQSIHMYGAGVLQNQVTPISQDYGSIWQESIIRTPNAIYGVDTYAKKIWKYNAEGFRLISDMVVQRFLNDNIILNEEDKYPIVALKNVKTHYNNYKGDVMFTFYNGNKVWDLCYNERLEKWITKYSWTPLSSANVNNIFLTLDRQRASLYGIIYDNINTNSGAHIEERLEENEVDKLNNEKESLEKGNLPENSTRIEEIDRRIEYIDKNFISGRTCGNLWEYDNIKRTIVIKGYDFFEKFGIRITSITSSILDTNGVEHIVEFTDSPKTEYDIKCKIINGSYKPDGSESEIEYSQYLVGDIDPERLQKKIGIIQNGRNLELTINDFEEVSKLLYLKIDFEVTPKIVYTYIDNSENISSQTNENKVSSSSNSFKESIVLIRDYNYLVQSKMEDKVKEYDLLLKNGFYMHGRAGVFDEINYFDQNPNNEIHPTKWYDKQEPFEFEFVVNNPAGIHKVFDNLVLISNNVEPNSLEFELVGDVYDFNKAGIYQSEHVDKESYWNPDGSFDEDKYNNDKHSKEFSGTEYSQEFSDNISIDRDPVLNQYFIKVDQPVLNIKRVGRRLGNIEYKEDRWYNTITPIHYKIKRKDGVKSDLKSTRIRDKWLKIRIKYTGDKLVVINAIQTLLRLSYA